jgi:hypothetical protein
MSADLASTRAAKARLATEIGDHPAVRGIGIARTNDGYALKVNLACAQPKGLELPDQVDEIPVIVEIVGEIVAHRPI